MNTARCRHLLRLLVVTALATQGLVAAATPSAAETLQVFAQADVWVDSWAPTVATVCGSGDVDHGTPLLAVWTFTVVGAGAAGPIAGAPGTPTLGGSFPTHCVDAVTGLAGGFVATLTLTAATTGGDVTAVCTLVGVRATTGTEVASCTDTT